MKTKNNSNAFTKKVWWFSVSFSLFASLIVFLFFLRELKDLAFLHSFFLLFGVQAVLGLTFGTLPTFWIFQLLSDFLFKKPISDLMLRIELIIWVLPIFTLNLYALNWIFLGEMKIKDLIELATFFYICLFCFILTLKIERENEFVKTESMNDILDDDLNFKK
ncbi:MAG: hypothetical protein AB8H03_18870 [Saprospiraceae bacterium]